MKGSGKTRFDARLTQEQKELFEHAARLSGRRSLTEFVITAAQRAADEIIEKHQFLLITTKRDQQIFFHALIHPPRPNQKLKKAAAKYKRLTSK
jgi:uncharacterized protein (DUF1778 family)